MKEKLKNCPFCGREPMLMSNLDHTFRTFNQFWVYCRCGASFVFVRYKQTAITRWNKRAEIKILCEDCASKFDCIHSKKSITDCTAYRRVK